MRNRTPPDDDWRDHAVLCENCGRPILHPIDHIVQEDDTDPGWYKCDQQEEAH